MTMFSAGDGRIMKGCRILYEKIFFAFGNVLFYRSTHHLWDTAARACGRKGALPAMAEQYDGLSASVNNSYVSDRTAGNGIYHITDTGSGNKTQQIHDGGTAPDRILHRLRNFVYQ